MNIEEVMENAKNLLSETKELENKKSQMEEELLAKIKANYEKIFMPEIQSLLELDTKLAVASEVYGYNTNTPLFSIYGKNGDFRGNFYIVNRSNHCDSTVYTNILHREYPDRDYPTDYKIQLLKEFVSEDSTLAHLATIKEAFAERFTSYAERLKVKNTMLSAQIEDLAKQLQNSSSVEEKSDGTIEITLNGKTYIGTVKEA